MSENPPPYPGDPSGQQPNDPSGTPQQPQSGQQYAGQQPYQQQYPTGPNQQWGTALPKHPQATLVLVLGILGLVVCQVLGPFAWVMGKRAVAEIDANPGVYDGRGEAQAGLILGIISTVILILGIVATAFFVVLLIVGLASASTSTEFSELSLLRF